MKFSIDGVELSEEVENEHHQQAELAFINRMIDSIS